MQCTASLPAHTCSVLCILSRFYSRTSRALDSFEMLVEVRSTLAPIPVYWFASNPNQMGKGAHNKAPETSPIRDQPGTQSASCDEEGHRSSEGLIQWIFLCDCRGRGRSIIGGAHIHIFVFTDCKNNRFQKKLMMHNTNI